MDHGNESTIRQPSVAGSSSKAKRVGLQNHGRFAWQLFATVKQPIWVVEAENREEFL